jgi:hypothetical protein
MDQCFEFMVGGAYHACNNMDMEIFRASMTITLEDGDKFLFDMILGYRLSL